MTEGRGCCWVDCMNHPHTMRIWNIDGMSWPDSDSELSIAGATADPRVAAPQAGSCCAFCARVRQNAVLLPLLRRTLLLRATSSAAWLSSLLTPVSLGPKLPQSFAHVHVA
eukprot:2876093-Rhodomonas_salina.2